MQVDKCKIDVENLNELIGLCEDKMVSPFKKKKPEVKAEKEETAEVEKKEKPDLSDMDIDDLVSMYKDLKEG